MKAIAIIAVLICCLLMFVVRREYKAGILIMGTIVFTVVSIPAVPFHKANILLPLSFLLSEVKHLNAMIRSTRGKLIWNLMGIAILLSVLTIIASPHLRDAESLRIFVQGELFFKYFVLLYAFWAFSTEESIKPSLRVTFYAMIVLTAFGVLNSVTKSADFVSLMTQGAAKTTVSFNGEDAGQVYMTSDRFRVQAMFLSPFDYGYICVLMLLLHIYGFIHKYETKIRFYIVASCCIFGILSCGCRTNIFCALIGVSVFFLLAYKFGKSIRLSLLAIFLASISYMCVPAVQEIFDNMMTMFDKNSNVTGSSMELRAVQYAAVLYHIQDNPLLGCGYQYFLIDMGWGQGREFLLDPRLAGLEGVIMNYILERGFIGVFLYLLFYISILYYFYKNRKKASMSIAFGISVLSVYLAFANMTGELSSVYPTLLLLGYVFKVIDNKRRSGIFIQKKEKTKEML